MTKASNSEQGETPARWDTIVIGSGISGLTAAAALARCGQRVLVLEQHSGHRAVAAEVTGS